MHGPMSLRGRRDSEVSPLADPLAHLLRRIDPEQRLHAYELWRFWDDVVGEQIARQAQPARLRNAVLFVTVASHVWMQELQFLKNDIRARLNERLGAALIEDIHL